MNLESVFGSLRRKYMAAAATQSRSARSRTRLNVQSLEAREVPAVIPAPTIDYTTTRSVADNSIAPVVAQDPLNPNVLFGAAVNTPGNIPGVNTRIQLLYSINGGTSWVNTSALGLSLDPKASTNNTNVTYTNVSNASVAFDRFHNVFLTYVERTADFSSGRVVLRKFNFDGLPNPVNIGQGGAIDATIYQWADTDRAYNPTVAVDINGLIDQPGGPTTADGQVDSIASLQTAEDKVNVYVAWNSTDLAPTNAPSSYVSNVVRMATSTNGGQDFGPTVLVNDNGHSGNPSALPSYSNPQITFTPGRAGQANSGGQLVTVFTNNTGGVLRADTRTLGVPDIDPQLDTVPHTLEVTADATVLGNNGFIQDGPAANTAPFSRTSTFSINVPQLDVDNSGINVLDNLSLTLSLEHNALAEISIDLVSPDGLNRITLLNNHTNNANASFTNVGIAAGTELGRTDFRFNVGTTFADNAARRISDTNTASTFTGDFRPEGGSLSNTFGGMTAAEMVGDWTVEVTDYLATGARPVGTPSPRLYSATLKFSENFDDAAGTNTNTGIAVNTNNVTGTGHPTANPANPAGLGSSVSIAADNTVGSFSPFQNRIYAAYESGGNVRVSFSDDAGQHWSTPATTVGAGFNPQLTVDPTTGTVVVTYYSTNLGNSTLPNAVDPTGTHVLTMMATSINGPDYTTNGAAPLGQLEFSSPTPVNPYDSTYDQITGKNLKVEYVPTNGSLLSAEGYGNTTGLIAYGGQVQLLYTGNTDRAISQVRTQKMSITSGPRVVAADSGVILGSAIVSDNAGSFVYNQPAANGQAAFDGFYVEFDRVIDPSSFTPDDIKIIYRAPGTDGTGPGVTVTATGISPVDEVFDPVDFSSYGSKKYFVSLPPQTGAGTYSYVIGSMTSGVFGSTSATSVSDRIPSVGYDLVTLPYVAPNLPAIVGDDYPSSDTNYGVLNATNTDIPDRVGSNPPTTLVSTISVPAPAAGLSVGDVSVTLNLTHTDLSDLSISLTSPSGQTVQLMAQNDAFGQDFDQTVFSDAGTETMAASFQSGPYSSVVVKPVTPFAAAFYGSQVNGTWTLRITDNAAGDQGILQDWTLQITKSQVQATPKAGNLMDQNSDGIQNETTEDVFAVPAPDNSSPSDYGYLNGTPVANHPFTAPYVTGSQPVVVAGPRVVSSQPVGQPASSDNLVLKATATGLDIAFDRTIKTSTFTAADIVRLTTPSGDLASLAGITVTPISALGGTPLAAGTNSKFYRITFPVQTISGQYQLQLSSAIQDTNNVFMDKDTNAGVAGLLGTSATAASTPVSYGTSDISVTVGAKQTVTVPLSISGSQDSYLLQKLLAKLSISVPSGGSLANLEVRLVSPDGSRSALLFQDVVTSPKAFTNVTFTDDTPTTPNGQLVSDVANGFTSGGFNNPFESLGVFNNVLAKGTWNLVIRNKDNVNAATVRHFELTFNKPTLGTGVGDPVADQTSLGFRIYQTDSSTTTAKGNWTPAGGAELGPTADSANTNGRVSNIQVDPSDPSGNTVYAAGASGGLWRSTNFLTRDSGGPTWVALTDFGANQTFVDAGGVSHYGSAINVGALAVYNDSGDPAKTRIVVGTGSDALNQIDLGQDNNRYDGVGFLYSEDSGKTWNVLDGKNNGVPGAAKFLPVGDPLRDHSFVGAVINKIVFERNVSSTPSTSPPVMYAAVGVGSTTPAQNVAGLYRSMDAGRTWTMLQAGDATDFVIGEGSARFNTASRPTIGYLAIRGVGVMTTNTLSTSANFTLTNGTLGRPTVKNTLGFGNVIPTNAPAGTPNGAKGKIVLVTPPFNPATPLANSYYQNWIVAAVSTPGGLFDGLYVSKDQGGNWTKVKLTTTGPLAGGPATTTAYGGVNDNRSDIETLSVFNNFFSVNAANHSLSLAMDPTNPNILYLGGEIMIQVDISQVNDPYKLQLFSHTDAGNAGAYATTTDSVADGATGGVGGGLSALDRTNGLPSLSSITPLNGGYDTALNDPRRPKWNFVNLYKNPYTPFTSDTTLRVDNNIASFQNDGGDVTWLRQNVERVDGFEQTELSGDEDAVSSIVTMIDPLTGLSRVIWTHDEGIGTFVPNRDGTLNRVDGFNQPGNNLDVTEFADTNLQVDGSRNGNIQVARFYSGDAQPSLLAASIAGSLLYGVDRREAGVHQSGAAILSDGQQSFDPIGRSGVANYVQADPTGSGSVFVLYQVSEYNSDFLQVQQSGGGLHSITGGVGASLFQNAADSSGTGQWNDSVRRFAVNPIDGLALTISSAAGRLFTTHDQGSNWSVIANPSDLGNTNSFVPAIAYGAPPTATSGLDDYLYAGTQAGRIFVRTGTAAALNWKEITGVGILDGSPIQKIVPSPTRGSNAVYAVTQRGVYFMADWTNAANTWQNLTGNLFSITSQAFKLGKDYETPLLRQLTTLAVDWRPTYSSATAVPTLYVGGDGGVARSTNNGTAWTRFTGTANGAAADGGGMPVVKISELDLMLGAIQPTTGQVDPSGSPNLLVATTLGRGMWTLGLGALPGASGPKILPDKVTPFNPINTDLSSVTVEFDSQIDPATFDQNDVTIVGPDGVAIPKNLITVTDITPDLPNGGNLHTKYEIDFPNQSADGTYTITIGPNISDIVGSLQNQNGDKINGQPVTAASVGDAFRFNVVKASNDIADFVQDAYQQLLGRAANGKEYLAQAVAIEKARLAGLAAVVKEILSGYSPPVPKTATTLAVPGSYKDESARIEYITRLYSGAGQYEIGDLLPNPTDATIAAKVQAAVAKIKAGTWSPEKEVIQILTGADYFATTQSVPNGQNAGEYLTKLYADLFKGLTINPLTDINPTVREAQLKQAATIAGRTTLVTSLVNGATVQYVDAGWSTSTVRTSTSYRNNFVTLAYASAYGPGRVITKAERSAGVAAMATALRKDTLAGSENVFAKIYATQAYFNLQELNPADQTEEYPGGAIVPVGDPAFIHSNRAWIEAVVKERFGNTPDVNGLYSTQAQRDYLSQKILDSYATARQTFLRAITATTEYKKTQVSQYYQVVLGSGRTATEAELTAGAKYSTIPDLIAAQFASAEFASTTPPGLNRQTMYSVTGTDPNDPLLTGGTTTQNRRNVEIVWAKAVYKILFGVTLTDTSTFSPLDTLASYSVSRGRKAAALQVLNAVDGPSGGPADATKFKPTTGAGGTYRELLIKQYFNDVLGRDPVGAFTDPSTEAGKALTYLKTNRWEYFLDSLLMTREFYEVVG